MSKKHKSKAVSGTKEEVRKKLGKKQEIDIKAKEPEPTEKATKVRRIRIPVRKLTIEDRDAFKQLAYMGPLMVQREVGKSLPKPTEQLWNTLFMEALRKQFQPNHTIMTCAENLHGLIWRFFLVGTDKQVRFATDNQFADSIGIGNPTFNGKKKLTGGIGLKNFINHTGIVPQRNKPENYRYIPASTENFQKVIEFMETVGFKRKVSD